MTSSLVNSNLGLSLIGDDKVTHISDLGLVDPAKYFEPTFKVATNFQVLSWRSHFSEDYQ
jgi:hypothetical protein